MYLLNKIMDQLTILFPPNPTKLRGALLRQQGKDQWQTGESGVFVVIPEDYCDGRLYASRLPAKVVAASSLDLIVEAGDDQYVCGPNGLCRNGFGVLVK